MLGWLDRLDPGLWTVKKAVRAAVLVPLIIALAQHLFPNPNSPTFAAFGSFAVLVFAVVGGRPRARLRTYALLFMMGTVNITLATLCSTSTPLAVLSMFLVGFATLFWGIVSASVANATTAALLTYVLPVAVPGGADTISDRLLGWTLAVLVSVPAMLLIWPTPWRTPIRQRIGECADDLCAVLGHSDASSDHAAQMQKARRSLTTLRTLFESFPYRPGTAAPADVAVVKLVGRTEWVGANALALREITPDLSPRSRDFDGLFDAVAALLRLGRKLVADTDRSPSAKATDVAATRTAVTALWDARQACIDHLWAQPESAGIEGSSDLRVQVQQVYRASILACSTDSFAREAVAASDVHNAAPLPTGPWRHPDETPTHRGRWVRRARAHASWRSVWLRNSVRGAVGLAVAVLIIEVASVQHGFWVALGTMSVLRSNSVGTRATAARAIAGTLVGFIIGAGVMILIGTNTAALWAIFPLAVFVAGLAPAVISFAAGQAGFTVVVIILFNLISPTGWEVGLVRIEDVAIGCFVSVVVGLLLWPRGARAALGQALGDAFAANVRLLRAAIVSSLDRTPDDETASLRSAEYAAQRMDDAVRQHLAETGTDPGQRGVVLDLVTGATQLRLSATTLAALPHPAHRAGLTDSSEAIELARQLRAATDTAGVWFDLFAASLTTHGVELPEPNRDRELHDTTQRFAEQLVAATGNPSYLIRAIRLMWIDQILQDLFRLREQLASARNFMLSSHRAHDDRGPQQTNDPNRGQR